MKYLLVNPWVYDFAAYNFGIGPVGLLKIAAYLKETGEEVFFLDCLGPAKRSINEYGFSKYKKTRIPKPETLKSINRPFFRYGISVEKFRSQLDALNGVDYIFVTSGMTYWYLGVKDAIALCRERFPDAAVYLGGVYATLCREHASKISGADVVFSGDFIKGRPGFEVRPAFELLEDRRLLPIETSAGCPFDCSYCAAKKLNPAYKRRDPVSVFEELGYCLHTFGTRNFVFYDDALLYEAEEGIKKLLRMVIAAKWELSFHAPNGLHAKFLDEELTHLMKRAGFRDIRIALETSDEDAQGFTGEKVTNGDIKQAVRNLKEAGFEGREIGIYVLLGAPWLERERVFDDIAFVGSLGARCLLASYSPIPGTRDYETMVERGLIEPEMDPLWHGNSVFCEKLGIFSVDEVRRLRRTVSSLRL